MLITAGDHVPVMPFEEVVARVAGVAPTQYGPSAAKEGDMLVLTITSIVATDAHCPTVGVKV